VRKRTVAYLYCFIIPKKYDLLIRHVELCGFSAKFGSCWSFRGLILF